MRPQTIQIILPDGSPTNIYNLAAVVLRRSTNGWKEWKDKNSKTLDELKRE